MAEEYVKRVPGTDEDWETVSGIIDRVDAFIVNPSFGTKKEYADKAQLEDSDALPLMFLADLVTKEGEFVGSQGYSVGGGWMVSKDGKKITHPARSNIIKTSVYGQMINTAVVSTEGGIKKYGTPLIADTWAGLGFFWEQKPHATVGGAGTKDSPMPTKFIGELTSKELKEFSDKAAKDREKQAAARGAVEAMMPGAPSAPELQTIGPGDVATVDAVLLSVPAEVMERLTSITKLPKAKFLDQALTIPEVSENDALLRDVLDDSDSGFWARNQGSK